MANNAIKAIMQRAFFMGPLAEKIVYNDTEIPAIVEIGEEFNRSEVYFKELDRAVKVSDKANFTVSDADVPNPKPGDSIIYNGQRWMLCILRTVLLEILHYRHQKPKGVVCDDD